MFPEDTGTYTCEAWNSAGEVRTQAMLTVQGEADPLTSGGQGQGQGQGGFAAMVSPKVIWRREKHVSLLCPHHGPHAPLVPSQPRWQLPILHLRLWLSGATLPYLLKLLPSLGYWCQAVESAGRDIS